MDAYADQYDDPNVQNIDLGTMDINGNTYAVDATIHYNSSSADGLKFLGYLGALQKDIADVLQSETTGTLITDIWTTFGSAETAQIAVEIAAAVGYATVLSASVLLFEVAIVGIMYIARTR